MLGLRPGRLWKAIQDQRVYLNEEVVYAAFTAIFRNDIIHIEGCGTIQVVALIFEKPRKRFRLKCIVTLDPPLAKSVLKLKVPKFKVVSFVNETEIAERHDNSDEQAAAKDKVSLSNNLLEKEEDDGADSIGDIDNIGREGLSRRSDNSTALVYEETEGVIEDDNYSDEEEDEEDDDDDD